MADIIDNLSRVDRTSRHLEAHPPGCTCEALIGDDLYDLRKEEDRKKLEALLELEDSAERRKVIEYCLARSAALAGRLNYLQ